MRFIEIKALYEEYCEWMADIDNAREQLSLVFKEANNISDSDWEILIDYSYQQM